MQLCDSANLNKDGLDWNALTLLLATKPTAI